jgi:hypothetical protein
MTLTSAQKEALGTVIVAANKYVEEIARTDTLQATRIFAASCLLLALDPHDPPELVKKRKPRKP